MKLYYSKASPFARKVRVSAILLGLDAQIELIEANPLTDPPELLEANPLGLIPTLVTQDGFAFFESPVICEYLNGIAKDLPIIPASGAARWISLRLQALGDGIMTAAVLRRKLSVQGKMAPQHPLAMRQQAAVTRTLDTLERQPPGRHIDIGMISVACALGYLDLRYPDEPWREGRPLLAGWFEEVSRRDCMQRTDPRL